MQRQGRGAVEWDRKHPVDQDGAYILMDELALELGYNSRRDYLCACEYRQREVAKRIAQQVREAIGE